MNRYFFSGNLNVSFIVGISVILQACGGTSTAIKQNDGPTSIYVQDPRLQPVQCAAPAASYINQDGPVIKLKGLSVIQQSLNSPYVDAGVIATDPQDGDISSKVVVKGLDHINVNQVGDYLIRYQVADTSGIAAAEVVRMVRVSAGDFSSLTARPLESTSSGEGYYERLPVSYGDSSEETFPLIIYLHGAGEAGANLSVLSVSQDATRPDRSLTALINPEQGQGTQHFIVLFPQRCAFIVTPEEVHTFIDYAIHTYKVDTSRIYLVGLSAGASQIWKYLEVYQDQVAAAATLAGADLADNVCAFKDVPTWAFHSADDPNVPVAESIAVVNRLNNCLPAPKEKPRLTVFQTGGHVIDEIVLPLKTLNQGLSAYDKYSPDIYTWFLEHHR